MKKALIVFFSGLAVAGAATLLFARSPGRISVADAAPSSSSDPLSARAQAIDGSLAGRMQVAIVVFEPRYGSSPRIIQVPQGPVQDSRADADEREEAVAPIEEDNSDAAPPPSRYRVIPLPRHSDAVAPKRQSAMPAPQRRSDIAPVPRHGDAPIMQKLHATVRLNEIAPPPQVRNDVPAVAPAATEDAATDDKLTPVYPTPRYDNKIEANDSGTSNRASVAAEMPPPVGYSPPSGVRDHPEFKFGPSKK